LGDGKAVSKFLAGLPHTGGDRPSFLHCCERIDKPVRSAGTAGIVGYRPLDSFNDAVLAPLRRRRNICAIRRWWSS
jgi:hypothetical protein